MLVPKTSESYPKCFFSRDYTLQLRRNLHSIWLLLVPCENIYFWVRVGIGQRTVFIKTVTRYERQAIRSSRRAINDKYSLLDFWVPPMSYFISKAHLCLILSGILPSHQLYHWFFNNKARSPLYRMKRSTKTRIGKEDL